MSEETTQSMDNTLATTTNNGLTSAAHDQSTIFQQNNAQQNEVLQSIVELRRQQVAQFEQRQRESDQLFTSLMTKALDNQAALNAQAAATTQQQNSMVSQQNMQARAATTAEHYADVGALTIIP